MKKYLTERRHAGLLRELVPVEQKKSGRIRAAGKEFINFSSNDYLGLSSHPGIIKAAREAAAPVFGSSSSRLMTGNTLSHGALEEETASFKGKPAALVFNSGYQANVGVISALSGRGDVIFSDRLNHASIIDGIILSGAKLLRFRHNDTGHLEELLSAERHRYRRSLMITETVFSMDGDIAPVDEITALKKKYDSLLMVDEAHATGVFGKTGAGIMEERGVTDDCDIVMGTFSKALGSFGAYVACSETLKQYLVNTCRSFIYSTALPVSVIRTNMAAIDIVKKERYRGDALLMNSAYLRERLKEKGFETKGDSQIIPVITGSSEAAVRLSEGLKGKGYWVTPVRPPTVPEGSSRLRVSVTCNHTREMIDRFTADLSNVHQGIQVS